MKARFTDEQIIAIIKEQGLSVKQMIQWITYSEYLSLRLSLRAHPMELLRIQLPESLPHEQLANANWSCRVYVPVSQFI